MIGPAEAPPHSDFSASMLQRCSTRVGYSAGMTGPTLAGLRNALITFLLLASGLLALAQPSTLMLADTSRRPTVSVSGPTDDGKTTEIKGERAYQSPGQKSLLGKNIEAYVALGGTRVDRGRADPQGAVVRVGLYKVNTKQLFFENIAEGGTVTVRVDGVFMNQPAVPSPKTGLMHIKYMLSDLTDCGLDGNARNLFNSVDPEDPLRATAQPDSGRWGGLDGGPNHGSLVATVQADGSTSIVCTFPYPFLRHLKDPYQREKPGSFFEPQHFHIELELLPQPAKAIEPSKTP